MSEPSIIAGFREQLQRLPEPGLPGRSLRRSRWPVIRLAAALAVVLAVLVPLIARDGGGVSAAERAFGAVRVAGDHILHVRFRFVRYNERGIVSSDSTDESWSVAGGPFRVVHSYTQRGKSFRGETAVADGVATSRTGSGPVVRRRVAPDAVLPPDPAATFRELYQRGQVSEVGRGSFGGRPTVRFRWDSGSDSVIYEVDASSYLPVRLTLLTYEPGTERVLSTTETVIEAYEQIPIDADTAALLRLGGR